MPPWGCDSFDFLVLLFLNAFSSWRLDCDEVLLEDELDVRGCVLFPGLLTLPDLWALPLFFSAVSSSWVVDVVLRLLAECEGLVRLSMVLRLLSCFRSSPHSLPLA